MKNELIFIADSFKIPTADGTEKLLKDFTPWELINIDPSVVLDIPTRLANKYAISAERLAGALQPHSIQTLGKDELEKDLGTEVQSPGAYFASATYHYSWPKAAGTVFCWLVLYWVLTRSSLLAVTGIGSKNIIAIKVNDRARMDYEDLEKHLKNCLETKRFVYAVVAIIGSTEHGACDPLDKLVELRKRVCYIIYLTPILTFFYQVPSEGIDFRLARRRRLGVLLCFDDIRRATRRDSLRGLSQ